MASFNMLLNNGQLIILLNNGQLNVLLNNGQLIILNILLYIILLNNGQLNVLFNNCLLDKYILSRPCLNKKAVTSRSQILQFCW